MYGVIASPTIRKDKKPNPRTITVLPIVTACKATAIAEIENMVILPPINTDLKCLATFSRSPPRNEV